MTPERERGSNADEMDKCPTCHAVLDLDFYAPGDTCDKCYLTEKKKPGETVVTDVLGRPPGKKREAEHVR